MSLIVELPAPSWNSAQALPIKTLAVTGPDSKEGLLFFQKTYVVPDHDRNNFLSGRSAFGMHCCRDLVPSFPEFTYVIAQAVAAHPAHLAPFPVTETARSAFTDRADPILIGFWKIVCCQLYFAPLLLLLQEQPGECSHELG